MIGVELDRQVQEYIRYFGEPGISSVVNTEVVIATGKGILISKDANLLSSITLTKAWAKYLLNRIGFIKWKATTKAKVNVEHFEEVIHDFLSETKMSLPWMKFPLKWSLILQNQTGINYIPVREPSVWRWQVKMIRDRSQLSLLVQ